MNEQNAPRIIAGFGRSGTTWVQDVLAESNQLRAVFEPLHPEQVRGAERYAHRCLLANDRDPILNQLLYRYFYDDYHSLWADYRIVKQRLGPKLRDFGSWRNLKARVRYIIDSKDNVIQYYPQRRCQQRIVKFVRANMMLSWLSKNFQPRIVYIIRHPAAVVMSQMRALADWNLTHRFEIYRSDKRLLSGLCSHVRELLFEPLEPVEAITLSWCIENTIALAQAESCGIHVVYYENLLENGESEWSDILSALGLSVMPEQSLIVKPSQQTWGEKATDSSLVRQYASWEHKIDKETASKIQNMLDATQTNLYSLSEALPTVLS